MVKHSPSLSRASRPPLKYLATFLIGLFVTFCSRQPTVLEQVREAGRLRFITWNHAASYYQGPNGPSGFEYDLVALFARELGVEATPVLVDTKRDVIPALLAARGELVAGLAVTPRNRRRVRFGPVYQKVDQQVIYRGGERRPRAPSDLVKMSLAVVSGSPQADLLRRLKKRVPELNWQEETLVDEAELLSRVWEGHLQCTVANANEVALTRRRYPELRVGFDIGDPIALAWAFPQRTDDSLYLAAIRFFNKIRKSGELEQLLERHYGHVGEFDYVDTRSFLRRTREVLPALEAFFREAGERYGLDWHLLAAMGYQESHWDPDAVSPTGVRGIMMLTGDTARQMEVEDRLDPRQSILGGARYFTRMKGKIPKRIPEPDRTWLALAAYNVGFGHLEDARRLTQSQGGNPDRWLDVKRYLPLLSKEKWFKKTRYGFARGHEPVRYVESVRRFEDLLISLERHQEEAPPPRPIRALSIVPSAL